MARETKFGLMVIVALVCAFGFVVYKKIQKRSDLLAEAEAVGVDDEERRGRNRRNGRPIAPYDGRKSEAQSIFAAQNEPNKPDRSGGRGRNGGRGGSKKAPKPNPPGEKVAGLFDQVDPKPEFGDDRSRGRKANSRGDRGDRKVAGKSIRKTEIDKPLFVVDEPNPKQRNSERRDSSASDGENPFARRTGPSKKPERKRSEPGVVKVAAGGNTEVRGLWDLGGPSPGEPSGSGASGRGSSGRETFRTGEPGGASSEGNPFAGGSTGESRGRGRKSRREPESEGNPFATGGFGGGERGGSKRPPDSTGRDRSRSKPPFKEPTLFGEVDSPHKPAAFERPKSQREDSPPFQQPSDQETGGLFEQPESQTGPDRKSPDRKSPDRKSTDRKSTEHRSTEHRSTEHRSTEHRSTERNRERDLTQERDRDRNRGRGRSGDRNGFPPGQTGGDVEYPFGKPGEFRARPPRPKNPGEGTTYEERNANAPFGRNGEGRGGPRSRSAAHIHPDDKPKVYTVQGGDNYWIISRRAYRAGAWFQALSAYNSHRIPDPTKIQPGMKVLVPSVEILADRFPKLCPGHVAGRGGRKAGKRASGFFRDEAGRPMYRIGKTDTLGDIAQTHLGRASRWVQIYEMNRDAVKTPQNLKIGAELRLPADASRVRVVGVPRRVR